MLLLRLVLICPRFGWDFPRFWAPSALILQRLFLKAEALRPSSYKTIWASLWGFSFLLSWSGDLLVMWQLLKAPRQRILSRALVCHTSLACIADHGPHVMRGSVRLLAPSCTPFEGEQHMVNACSGILQTDG